MMRSPRNRAKDLLVTAAWLTMLLGLASLVTASPTLAQVTGVLGTIVAMLGVEVARRSSTPTRAPDRPRVRDAPRPHHAVAPTRPLRAAPPASSPEPAVDGRFLSVDFLTVTLHGRVSAARRALRPLSLVCFESLEGGARHVPVDAGAVERVLENTLREADLAGLLADGTYVCLLEDTSEDGAVWTAERIRQNLVAGGPRRFRAGVASYPSHGLEPDELLAKATEALVIARDWSRDRIEVATVT